ncbi:MAG TPA: MarR family transcriptional regulator [Streptosporangiaceae bacterium]|nr:MarR family transcriptional regulator [Streptosporangiaceae bacterium]
MASLATNSTASEPGAELIEALGAVTRVLVGIALRSLDVPGGSVSLPQFRVLAIIFDLGPTRPGRIARALGIEPSTVTRLADRLVASGHIVRSSDPEHRGAVSLTLTEHGREVVTQVAQWRRRELARIAAQLTPSDRAAATRALRRVVDAAGPGYGAVIVGLMPL